MPPGHEHKHYLKNAVIEFQYLRAKEDSADEIAVANVWETILSIYFPTPEGYFSRYKHHTSITEAAPRGHARTYERADLNVSKVLMSGMEHVTFLVLEARRNDFVTHEDKWESARQDLIDHMESLRRATSESQMIGMDKPMYLMLAVGTWLRVYISNHSGQLKDFDQLPGRLMELEKDEERVHHILTKIHRLVGPTAQQDELT